MGAIKYTAQRSLVTGHIAGEIHTIAIAFTDDTTRSAATEKVTNRSLSGVMEVIRYYTDKNWNVVTEPVNGWRLREMREFLDSTDGGEVFSLDFTASNTFTNFKRTDAGYTESPFSRVGNPDEYDYFTLGFSAIEV